MELSEEERQMVLKRRKTHGEERETKSVAGIGTGIRQAEAKIKKRKFIDEATYIEVEGDAEQELH